MRLILFILFITLSYVSFGSIAGIDTGIEEKSDKIFLDQNRMEPGFSVGVFKKDEVLLTKSYGYSNLDLSKKNSNDSKFYIASMSKQFTAGIIALMIIDGKISLDDKISKYIKELPEIYKEITIKQCLFHTSGLKEYTSLMLFRGDDKNIQDRMNTDDAYSLILSQENLNFKPGTQFSYSSSGYVLLTKLIEEIEQTSLRNLAKENIFKPLGMKNTLFEDNHSEVIPNRVTSYKLENHNWERWLKHFDVVGDGGVLTTNSDLYFWQRELLTGERFGQKWKSLMMTKGTLDNGTELKYGFGLWHLKYKGFDAIYHNGGLGAFIADGVIFPKLDLSIYVLANRNDNKAFRAFTFIDELLPSSERTLESVTDVNHPTVNCFKEKYLGAYFLDDINNRLYIVETKNNELAITDSNKNVVSTLKCLSDKGIYLTDKKGEEIEFKELSGDIYLTKRTKTNSLLAKKYLEKFPEDINQLKQYIGNYYSKELNAMLRVSQKGESIVVDINNSQPITIFPDNNFDNVNWNKMDAVWLGFAMLKFRNQKGKTPYIELGDSRVNNVRFDKIDVH